MTTWHAVLRIFAGMERGEEDGKGDGWGAVKAEWKELGGGGLRKGDLEGGGGGVDGEREMGAW